MLRTLARKTGAYLLNVLISVDQLVNTIAAGDPDETISSRVGKVRERHGGQIPWSSPLCKIIDSTCEIFDKNHTLEAIERDEGQMTTEDRKCPIECCLYCSFYGLMEFDGLSAPCTAFKNRVGKRQPFHEPFFKCGSFDWRQISPRMES